MDDECRHVELREIFGKVRFGERLDAIEGSIEPALHPLEPERVAKALRHLGARPVGAVERRRSEEHTSELQSHLNLVCRLLLEKKKRRSRSTLTGRRTTSHASFTCSATDAAGVCQLIIGTSQSLKP